MRFFVLAMLVISMAGCGGNELVPVSGTITMDGEPLEGAEVVFAPQQISGQVDVGPASVGITDANGKYVLKTSKGELGAFVASHTVAIKMNVLDEGELAAVSSKAFQENKNITRDEIRAVREKARQEMMNRTPIPESYNRNSILKIKIEKATETANFELKSDGSQ